MTGVGGGRANGRADVTEHHVRSADGTRIGYLRRGSGPGLVLVQGAMATARAFDELADLLAPRFTVIGPDRRGRGLSPRPFDAGHRIARDVEDLEAVLDETAASAVLGLSSGAVIALEAARVLPRVTRVIAYEPPFSRHGLPPGGVARLGAEIERGDLPSALIDALMTAGTAPAALRVLPRPVARLLAAAVLAVDARRTAPPGRLVDLLPGVRYDFAAVGEMDGRLPTFTDLTKPALLLGGTRSPAFLRRALRDLERVLPDARLEELPGLGHDGPWNRGRGGRPEVVAPVVARFLTATAADGEG